MLHKSLEEKNVKKTRKKKNDNMNEFIHDVSKELENVRSAA